MYSIPVDSDGFPNGVLHRWDLFLSASFIFACKWGHSRSNEDTSLCDDGCNCNLLQLCICGFANLGRRDVEGLSQVGIADADS